jgi:dethiobiotin synthetase
VSNRLVIMSGTGTGVGKTWVARGLARLLLRRGLEVAVRKPVQSFDPDDGPTDAALLAAATGESEDSVCPLHRSYGLPMAPPMAADALGLAGLNLADLVAELVLPRKGVAIVEGVGGPRSPLAHDADTVALAEALAADAVLLVAPSGLGAINDVLLARSAFGERNIAVYMNRFDPADPVHSANRRWLEARLPHVHTNLESLAGVVAGELMVPG